jgi:hypothetical protein
LFDYFSGNSNPGGDEFASVLEAWLGQAGRSQCSGHTDNGTYLRNNVAPTGLQNGCRGGEEELNKTEFSGGEL